jgi:uncharacterized protein YciI
MYYILFYDLVDDYVERRGQFRAEHLGLANEALERGELLLAGAHGEPIDGATLVFTVDDPAIVERFAQNDPYVKNGLVTSWRVVPWHVVVGGGSSA